MIRVVLDTNVLVSAVITLKGNEAAALDVVANAEASLYVSEAILDEFAEVLWRPKLRLDPIRVQFVLDLIRRTSQRCHPLRRLTVCPHDPDNRFLECADAASADFLVTGNKRHFPPKWKCTRIVNSREFLQAIHP